MSWYPYNKGKTISTKGSENGKIVLDEEHIDGARISLEENSFNAPYAITLGIYGVMFHTDFFSELEESKSKYNLLKKKVELLLQHLSIEEKDRKDNWRLIYNEMLDNLIV